MTTHRDKNRFNLEQNRLTGRSGDIDSERRMEREEEGEKRLPANQASRDDAGVKKRGKQLLKGCCQSHVLLKKKILLAGWERCCCLHGCTHALLRLSIWDLFHLSGSSHLLVQKLRNGSLASQQKDRTERENIPPLTCTVTSSMIRKGP